MCAPVSRRVPGLESGLYQRIIEQAFQACFRRRLFNKGTREFVFERSALEQIVGAVAGARDRAKNTSDTIYYFRYRQPLPNSIADIGLDDRGEWVIRDLGTSRGTTRYAFCLVPRLRIEFDAKIEPVKMLDATPAMISRYADYDEQAILASVRYNRLLDAFLGMPCYSLQSHMRRAAHPDPDDENATVQVDVDEMYVGVDGDGAQYALPVEAKVGTEHVGRIQIEKNLLLCSERYPNLRCRPVAIATGPPPLAGRLEPELRRAVELLRRRHIVLFEFHMTNRGNLSVVRQAQYYLVPSDFSAYDGLPEELRRRRLILDDGEVDAYRRKQ